MAQLYQNSSGVLLPASAAMDYPGQDLYPVQSIAPPVPVKEKYCSGQLPLTDAERYALRKLIERYLPLDEAAKKVGCTPEAIVGVVCGLLNKGKYPQLLRRIRSVLRDEWLHAIRPHPSGGEIPSAQGREEFVRLLQALKE